jgi:hypothetical protein
MSNSLTKKTEGKYQTSLDAGSDKTPYHLNRPEQGEFTHRDGLLEGAAFEVFPYRCRHRRKVPLAAFFLAQRAPTILRAWALRSSGVSFAQRLCLRLIGSS